MEVPKGIVQIGGHPGDPYIPGIVISLEELLQEQEELNRAYRVLDECWRNLGGREEVKIDPW